MLQEGLYRYTWLVYIWNFSELELYNKKRISLNLCLVLLFFFENNMFFLSDALKLIF